jgi:hypothetical protein
MQCCSFCSVTEGVCSGRTDGDDGGARRRAVEAGVGVGGGGGVVVGVGAHVDEVLVFQGAKYMSSYYYIFVLTYILYHNMCPHTTVYVFVLLYVWWLKSCSCVLKLILYICSHTSFCCICVLMLLFVLMLLRMCPHTTVDVSSYYYIFVLILLHMCPLTATLLSTYCYICDLYIECSPHSTPHYCLFLKKAHLFHVSLNIS